MTEEGSSEEWARVGGVFLALAAESMFFIMLIVFAIFFTDLSRTLSIAFLPVFIFLFLFTLMTHVHFHGGLKRGFQLLDLEGGPLHFDRIGFLKRFQEEFELEKAPWIGSFNITLGKSVQLRDRNDDTVRVEFNKIVTSPKIWIMMSRSASHLSKRVDEFLESYTNEVSKATN